jgi:LacI family transcriptional regulator
VAKQTGLSIATISKFINGGNVIESNRVIIEQAIRETGFRVNEIARGLKTSRTMTIGILIPNLENVFCTSIVANVENTLLQQGYSSIICDYREDRGLEHGKLDFLVNKMVDGIIYMPLDQDPAQVARFLDGGLPIILIDRPIPGVACDTVLVDNLNASYHAVEELITRGHRRVGIISGPDDIYTARERLKGYQRVHEDYGMTIEPDLVARGDYRVESGFRLMSDFITRQNPPSAVFITNYEMTMGAVMALNENHVKVPAELSVIGFDNLQMARVVSPALTIVVQPMRQIGETAAALLLKRLKGDLSGFPAIHRLKTELVQGESVCTVL